MAFSYTGIPIFLGEVSPNHLRSRIGLFMTAVNNFGVLWIYAIGSIVDLWLSSLLCALPIFLFIISYKFLPETPHFLIKQKKFDEGKEVLKKLRTVYSEQEFENIKNSIVEINFRDSFKELWLEQRHRRALLICVVSLALTQLTGGTAFIFYAYTIFKKAGNVSPNTLSLVKAFLQLLSSIFAAYVVERTGKRPLLIISCIGSSVFTAAEGIYFLLLEKHVNLDSIWWLPIVSMVLFDMFQAIGVQPIAIAYLGELFDPSVKPIAVCISKIGLALSVFTVGQLFQVLIDNFSISVPFFLFSSMGIFGLIFVLLYVPETRGKSLEDIQHYFKYKTYEKIEGTNKV